ncbi:MAG: phenylalanine--tRNA ligase subunit beta [Spirochaetes bacterium GWB1_66_5]|nr:MAG: phenylalanine--tRNA ligase subunit beta [Spirochaetes bacterium GWB1_66_5]
MPKIECSERTLFGLLGRKLERKELEELLPAAKAELDDWAGGVLKIELNDTNRPDLWSGAGLARQLRVYLGGQAPEYPFVSSASVSRDFGGRTLLVDEGLRRIRPYSVAFLADGRPIGEDLLKELIQSQEKLCWNYGRKRSSIAMGVMRGEQVKFPVRFQAADPDKTSFVPLDFDRPLTLRQILKEHPKGVEFGPLIAGFPRFPHLVDAEGRTLSMPPVINSAHLGSVKVGDTRLFVELSGTDLDSLLTACAIMACDLSDAGYAILPVKVIYPYDTPHGREIVTPFHFQKPVDMDLAGAARLLGRAIKTQEAEGALRRMGLAVKRKGEIFTVTPPVYRNDFLHPVDVVEELMIGCGMDSFQPVWPEDFTVGRLTESGLFGRRVRDLLVGLGYQEMIYNYLGSWRDLVERMNLDGGQVVEIANPMSESYELVRNSALPGLLASEAASSNAAYPHRIFEIGKVAVVDERENYGSRTFSSLALLYADREAGYNHVRSHLSSMGYYLSRDIGVREAQDPRFIAGRGGELLYKGRAIGIIGEIHPAVLDAWGIQMPCAALELDLEKLLEA